MTKRLVEFLVSLRWLLLVLAAVLAAAAFGPSRGVEFDRSVENMFAADDPLLPPYRKLKRTFGGNEIVLAVYTDPQLLQPSMEGIRRLIEISNRCEQVEGVRAVLSLDRPIGEKVVANDSTLAVRTRELFENYTHSPDGRVAAAVCMLEPEAETSVPRQQTIDDLRGVMQNLPDGLAPGLLTGEPVMVADGFRYIEEDGQRLGLWSTILLGLTILLCFRSLRWVLVPLAVVQLTLLLTKAAMVWSQLRLSMVSSMLTAIVTVVGVATIVHVIVRFRQAREAGRALRAALVWAAAWCAAPVTWAIATDMAGFGSLMLARVGPVQDFGLMMAIGASLVLVSTALLLPGLTLLGHVESPPRPAWGEARVERILRGTLHAVLRRPKTIGLVAAAVAGVAVSGVARLEVETDFTRNFRSNSPVVISYKFVEKEFGGAGVLDVLLPAPDRLDWDYLRRVQKLEDRLRMEVTAAPDDTTPALTKVLSLADAVIGTSPVDLAKVRLFRSAMVRTSLKKMRTRMPDFTDALYGEDPQQPGQYYFRLMIRAGERQPAAAKRRIIEEVTRISCEEFPAGDETPGAEVTGFFVLLTNLIESMIRDQWLTFGVATACVALMMLIAFRSLPMAVAALVPNGLPILMLLGVMGWLGVPINMGAAMIAAVSMGLSVDSSTHYVISFRRARSDGRSVSEALEEVQQSVGRAVILSTVALIVGFTVLCSSQFVPTIYFGLLVSLAMLGGLSGNLVFLPLLLKLVVRERREPES